MRWNIPNNNKHFYKFLFYVLSTSVLCDFEFRYGIWLWTLKYEVKLVMFWCVSNFSYEKFIFEYNQIVDLFLVNLVIFGYFLLQYPKPNLTHFNFRIQRILRMSDPNLIGSKSNPYWKFIKPEWDFWAKNQKSKNPFPPKSYGPWPNAHSLLVL